MKLDKRFILAASLVLGLGLGFQACSDDDDSSDEAKTECKVNTDCKDKAKPVCTAGKCVAETPTDTNACKDKTEGADCGEGKTCQKGADDKLECKANTTGGSDGAKCTQKNGNKDCSGDTPVCLLDSTTKEGKCIAAETKECIKSSNCTDTAKPICSDGKCVAESEALACAEAAPKCAEGKFCNSANNKCEDDGKKRIVTCGDQKVDVAMKEICDRDKGGAGIFPDKEMSCEKYMEMMSIPSTVEYNKKGKPGCSSDCLQITEGSCNFVFDTCEGDNWKEADKCRVIGGKTMVKDGETTREATCNDYKKDSGMTGMPGCSKDCKGFSKGTCGEEGGEQPAPTAINGVKSCKVDALSFVTTDDGNKNKIMGQVTVVTENADDTVKGAVLCVKSDDATTTFGQMVQAVVNDKIVADGADGVVTAHTNAYTAADNGTYKCVVAVQNTTTKTDFSTNDVVICSDSGTVTNKATGDNKLGGAKIAEVPNTKEITVTVQ